MQEEKDDFMQDEDRQANYCTARDILQHDTPEDSKGRP